MKAFVKKVVRMRKAMLRRGCSMKNEMRMHKAIEKFERHLNFYPNANDRAIRNFCKRHKDDLLALLPGKGSSSHDKLMNEFNQYLSV